MVGDFSCDKLAVIKTVCIIEQGFYLRYDNLLREFVNIFAKFLIYVLSNTCNNIFLFVGKKQSFMYRIVKILVSLYVFRQDCVPEKIGMDKQYPTRFLR